LYHAGQDLADGGAWGKGRRKGGGTVRCGRARVEVQGWELGFCSIDEELRLLGEIQTVGWRHLDSPDGTCGAIG
jgi:hypothetical protein